MAAPMENQQSTRPAQLLCSCLRTIEARPLLPLAAAPGLPAAHPRPAPRLLAAADLPPGQGPPQPSAATRGPKQRTYVLRPPKPCVDSVAALAADA